MGLRDGAEHDPRMLPHSPTAPPTESNGKRATPTYPIQSVRNSALNHVLLTELNIQAGRDITMSITAWLNSASPTGPQCFKPLSVPIPNASSEAPLP